MAFKLVKIDWVDSENAVGWQSLEAISGDVETSYTVGLLVVDTLTHIVVAHTYDPSTEEYCGAITIPRVCILRERTLARVACG